MNIFRNTLLILIGISTMILPASLVLAAGKGPAIKSSTAIVLDQKSGAVLYEKNANDVVPIASITKLMTAMVLLDSRPNLRKVISITKEDIDNLRHSKSRLPVGTSLSIQEMLRLALMSSENRAASALSRNYPGGKASFVKAMNRKAQALGLRKTHFRDATGLYKDNVSSARDLVKLVAAAARYPLVRKMTTTASHQQKIGRKMVKFNNTNILTKNPKWRIGVSKTGFINESGKCLVMQTWMNNRPTIIVLLDSWGRLTPVGDSNRIKQWISNFSVADYGNRG